MLESRGDYFWFGSIFIYKNNQIDLKKKKLKPIQTDRFRFSYFRTKTETQPTGFGSVRLFYIKNKNIYFFGVFFVISNGFDFDLARFFLFSFSVSGLWNQNWTELIGFLNILISLINFFYHLIFSIILFF